MIKAQLGNKLEQPCAFLAPPDGKY